MAIPDEPINSLEGIVKRNVRTLVRVRRDLDARRTLDERIADRITSFVGTMRFAYLHAAPFGGWIVANCGVIKGLVPPDPFPRRFSTTLKT